ncbi:MAG: hypothetical protein JXA89_07545 [Anaerolineae bacterium]|nr:hypothetical protein [Anaerolineae bacterium]
MTEPIRVLPDNTTQSGALVYDFFKYVSSSYDAYNARQATLESLNQISSLYQSENPEAVQGFLSPRPDLIPVLIEAYDLIKAYFGDQPTIQLKLVRDPEFPVLQKLFAYIQTDLPVSEAMTLADQIDDDWFDLQPSSIDDHFMIAVRFV